MTLPTMSQWPDEGTTGQVTIGMNPQQILNRRKNRCGVKLTNLTDVDIYFGFNGGVTPQSGDLLLGKKGAWIFLPVESAIWAVCNSAAVLSYMEIL